MRPGRVRSAVRQRTQATAVTARGHRPEFRDGAAALPPPPRTPPRRWRAAARRRTPERTRAPLRWSSAPTAPHAATLPPVGRRPQGPRVGLGGQRHAPRPRQTCRRRAVVRRPGASAPPPAGSGSDGASGPAGASTVPRAPDPVPLPPPSRWLITAGASESREQHHERIIPPPPRPSGGCGRGARPRTRPPPTGRPGQPRSRRPPRPRSTARRPLHPTPGPRPSTSAAGTTRISHGSANREAISSRKSVRRWIGSNWSRIAPRSGRVPRMVGKIRNAAVTTPRSTRAETSTTCRPVPPSWSARAANSAATARPRAAPRVDSSAARSATVAVGRP